MNYEYFDKFFNNIKNSNSIKKFYVNNKVISIVFIISVICSISYIWTLDKQELIKGVERWYNFVFQLSVGYMINFGFYITQVYIPENKKMKSINKCISKKLENLANNMIEPLQYMSQKYLQQSKSIFTEQEIQLMANNVNIHDFTSRVNLVKHRNFTFIEVFIDSINRIESIKDTIFLYYSPYLKEDLINVLEEITNSSYFIIIPALTITNPNSINRTALSKCILEYYNLYSKLIKIKKSYE